MLNESPINQDIPKTYHMNFVKNPQSRYIFDEDPDGNALSIAGTIQYEFHVNPELDEDYRRIMKERNQQSSKPKRTVQVVDESKGSTRINILAPVNEYDLVHRSKRKLSPDSRRERLPKPELMDMIFRAFEREPYWSLKNLTEHTNQPSVWALRLHFFVHFLSFFMLLQRTCRRICVKYCLKLPFLTNVVHTSKCSS